MKKLLLIIALFFVNLIGIYGQCTEPSPCSTPACSIAVSGTNYVLAAGQSLYISSNYTSGTITLSGGTVYIQSGFTLSGSISNGAGGTINNCGTLSGTRNFNNTITVNNYATSASMVLNGGPIVNNYGASSTMTVNGAATVNNYGASSTMNFGGTAIVNNYGASSTMTFSGNSTVKNYATGSTFTMASDNGFNFTNSSTGASLSINGNPNNAVTINNTAGATLTVPSSINLKDASLIDNFGTITWSSSFGNFTNKVVVKNRTGATFNATNTGNAIVNANFENNGTMSVAANGVNFSSNSILTNRGTLSFSAGITEFNSGNNTNNWGTLNFYDFSGNGSKLHLHGSSLVNINHQITKLNNSFDSDGCAVIDVSTTSSIESSIANNTLTDDPDVNLCGKAPYKNQDSDNITAATNTSPITITVSSDNNGRLASAASSGLKVYIYGGVGNTAINGYWTITNWNSAAKTFDLVGSNGTSAGTYTGSAIVYPITYMDKASYLGYSNCVNPCPPLPVKFLYFNATKEDHKVRLNWATATENNNARFIIQRSTDGENYTNISSVEGSYNSSSTLDYVDYDMNPALGVSYYRLKQVDLDGKSSFSQIAVVKFSADENWTIYPNPSSGSFTMSSSFDETENIQVTLLDITGRIVKYYSPNEYSPKMEINDLAKGMYLISISSSNGVTSKKVIVQ